MLAQGRVESRSSGELAAAIDRPFIVEDAVNRGKDDIDLFLVMTREFSLTFRIKIHLSRR
jgi:hypothetical protein